VDPRWKWLRGYLAAAALGSALILYVFFWRHLTPGNREDELRGMLENGSLYAMALRLAAGVAVPSLLLGALALIRASKALGFAGAASCTVLLFWSGLALASYGVGAALLTAVFEFGALTLFWKMALSRLD